MRTYLGWKKLAHWVVSDKYSNGVNSLDSAEVFEDFESIERELIVEQPVAEEHRGQDGEDVEDLTTCEPDVVLSVLVPVVVEVISDLPNFLLIPCLAVVSAPLRLGSVCLALQDAANEAVLKEPLPRRPREPGQDEADGEEVGQPQVVGSHWGVLLRLDLGLVHETPRGFTP